MALYRQFREVCFVASGIWNFLALIFTKTCQHFGRSTAYYQCLSLKLFLGRTKTLPLKIYDEDARYDFWPTAYLYFGALPRVLRRIL